MRPDLTLAELVKFTLVALFPLWAVLWLAALFRWRATLTPKTFAARAGEFLLLIVTSVYVINAGYEFHGTCYPLGDFPFVSRTLAGTDAAGHAYGPGQPGNRFAGTPLGRIVVPLPDDYVRGMDVQRQSIESYEDRLSYFRGEWRPHGRWYYYLYAAGVKVPLGFLGLLLIGLYRLAATRTGVGRLDLLVVAGPLVALIALVSAQTAMNRHLRYILPAFPFAVLLVGPATRAATRWGRLLVGGLLAWGVASSLAVYPCSLSYFNEAGGGPTGGPWHLASSNVDWGQDLLRLKRWREAHPDPRPLHLAYFNYVDPNLAGVRYSLSPVGQVTADRPVPAAEAGPRPGLFAVSVSYVQGSGGLLLDGQGGQTLIPPNGYGYFRRFTPVDRAGYAILIYDITPEQADAVRRGVRSTADDNRLNQLWRPSA